MIVRRSTAEIAVMRRAGRLVAEVLGLVEESLRPGVSTAHLDEIAEGHIRKAGGVPSFKGYNGYPSSICISIDREVVHGIPGHRTIADGQVVSIDAGAIIEGYHGDAAYTAGVGQISDAATRLIEVTERSLWAGIDQLTKGNRLNEVGRAVQQVAEAAGYSVVRVYASCQVTPAFALKVRVENALDRRYEPVNGYPQPGTGIFGSAEIRF